MAEQYQEIHKKLIEASKEGSRKAQYKLYQLYSRAMFNICWRMMNNREEAEDMLQEAFSEVFMKLDSYRYESSFGAWVKRIVINKCINEMKRKKAELCYYDDLTGMNKPPAGEDEVDYEQMRFEVQKVRQAIAGLPDGYRIIFSLYLLEGYDHSEISQILGISESTSKSQYMRAKIKVRDLLKTMDYESR